jgi:hypothetical protein
MADPETLSAADKVVNTDTEGGEDAEDEGDEPPTPPRHLRAALNVERLRPE